MERPMNHKQRTWMTRVTAILGVTAITLTGMFMQIDGIFVPLMGTTAVGGIAGYHLALNKARKVAKAADGPQ